MLDVTSYTEHWDTLISSTVQLHSLPWVSDGCCVSSMTIVIGLEKNNFLSDAKTRLL